MNQSLVMTSVRLDRDLHAALRQIAFDRRVSIHSLLIEGAHQAVQKYGTEPSSPSPQAATSTFAGVREFPGTGNVAEGLAL